MATKKVKTTIKLNLPAGEATPAPPLGPALGQHGVAIMEFVKAYNARTEKMKGTIIPAVVTIFEDRTFSFVTKLPPLTTLIKQALKVEKGSKTPGKSSAGTLTMEQVRKIAEEKLPDLNTKNVEAAMRIVEGAARSMGIQVK
ncbi:MAG TPA: 50S ribosomal protein L11 [Candidatus Nanoarchaeia archaeon]|nr:50S ribosomal protein L11 [Candidatus Nanoarchaeia archaeon]